MYPKELCEHIVDICEDEYGGEKNKDLDNLYLQCQSCVNKYTSFECALCEDFDMYKEEVQNYAKKSRSK